MQASAWLAGHFAMTLPEHLSSVLATGGGTELFELSGTVRTTFVQTQQNLEPANDALQLPGFPFGFTGGHCALMCLTLLVPIRVKLALRVIHGAGRTGLPLTPFLAKLSLLARSADYHSNEWRPDVPNPCYICWVSRIFTQYA